jgi:hypothetical protein
MHDLPEYGQHELPDVPAKVGISIFSGVSQGHVSDMMSGPQLPDGMVLEGLDSSELAGGSVDDIIFRQDVLDGFSLANIRLAPDYILPTHHHDVDCLYYVLSGWILLGRRRIDAGGGFMVSALRPYGYRAGPEGAAVLEFRKAASFNMVITETSPTRWQEIGRVAAERGGWPGFVESAVLPHSSDA